MKPPESNLSVWVGDQFVWIRVTGRANFTCCVDFKALINGLWQQNYRRFLLDLTNCMLMDSTFLGVLSGLGLRLGAGQNEPSNSPIQLLNPNPRVSELLENLGVMHLFYVRNDAGLKPEGEFTAQTHGATNPIEIAQTSLAAHETLMAINPDNVAKFKDVAKFLSEDLKRMETEAGAAKGQDAAKQSP
jgi:anti-sigma B factor antagonist